MRTLGPLSTSLWPSSRAPPAAAVSVTGKLADNRWNPIKLAYKFAGWPAQLATSAFNQLGPYANVTGPSVTHNSPAVFFEGWR